MTTTAVGTSEPSAGAPASGGDTPAAAHNTIPSTRSGWRRCNWNATALPSE